VAIVAVLRQDRDAVVLCVDFCIFLQTASCGGRGVLPYREADSLGRLTPFQIIGTFRVPLFLAIDDNPVRPNAAVCRKDTGQYLRPWGVLIRLVTLISRFAMREPFLILVSV
jgi:hypothetical protein